MSASEASPLSVAVTGATGRMGREVLAAARERGVEPEALDGLDDAVVGTIGEPTRESAEAAGIRVDVVPKAADFEALARAVVARLDR